MIVDAQVMRRYGEALGEQVAILGEMSVGEMWDRMLGEFLGEWERLNRLQLDEVEFDRQMQAFMDDLSEKPMERLARQASTVAYNQGRGAAILDSAAKGAAQFVVRSEILDQNTCDVCARLDSTVYDIGSSEYYANQPPAGCEGGDNCRGFYVAIPRDLVA